MSRRKKVNNEYIDTSTLDPELITELSRRENISRQESERRCKIFLDCARSLLIRNQYLTLRRFGLFHIGTRKKSRVYNPRTEQFHEIPLTKVVRFKPAESIKREINREAKEQLIKKLKEQKDI